MIKNHNKLNAVTFLSVVLSIVLASVSAFAEGRVTYPPVEGQPVKAGEGFLGVCPSYFVGVKVDAGHYSDFGSGCFIAPDTILSCAHNIRDYHEDGKGKLSIISHDGRVYTDLKVYTYQKSLDVSVIKINNYDGNGTHSVLDVAHSLVTGDTVYSVGWNPGTSQVERHKGLVNNWFYTNQGPKVLDKTWQSHTARVVQGMSGGPLLDVNGDICGVNVFSEQDGSGSGSVSLYWLRRTVR